MTRIFLRRGTSSDLSSVVLATGEAAYATDTKVLKIGDGGSNFAALSGLVGGTAGGVSAFTALSDTPGNFSGAGNRFVKVNSSANALEFVAGSGGGGGGSTLTDEQVQDIVGAMLTGNTETGITVTYQDGDGTIDFSVASQTDENFTTADHTKLDGIEALADVTDATNVDAAGAVMNSDTSTASMSFVVDEDTMTSNSNTKVPTQQSVKAYVDANSGGGGSGIASVAADTTPQLGGDLDVDGNDIVSASNGDIDLLPNGNGKVVFRGGGTGTGANGAGRFKLNCENNSHGITIQGPPHSAGATYTLTLPNDDGATDQLLKTDGNGVLSWANDADTNTTYTAGSGLTLVGTQFNADIKSNTTAAGGGTAINNIVTIASGDYTALSSKDANTLYFLT